MYVAGGFEEKLKRKLAHFRGPETASRRTPDLDDTPFRVNGGMAVVFSG